MPEARTVSRRRFAAWLVGIAFACASIAAFAQQPVTAGDEAATLRARLARNESVLRDWPELSRYRAENAALPAPDAKAPRVVFLGDSITDFWGRQQGEFFPGRPYVNRGISGQTTAQMLLRFRPDVIALKPAVVVILAGTNDLAGNTGPATDEEIRGNLLSMEQLARANGIRVVMATLLPVSDDFEPITVDRPPARILALNDWIRGHCAQTGCVPLDYFAATVDGRGRLRREFTQDGLHPNARGYAAMQAPAAAAIARALAAPAPPATGAKQAPSPQPAPAASTR